MIILPRTYATVPKKQIKMKKYTFLDFDGVISQMKRWFYGALKFIAVYILMVMLFMAYFYWYPEKEMNNMNRRTLMYQECLRSHFHWQK